MDDWFGFNVHNRRLQYLNGNNVGPVAEPSTSEIIDVWPGHELDDLEVPEDPEEDPLDVGDQAAGDHCGCGSPACSPNVSDHEGNDYDAYETPDTE